MPRHARSAFVLPLFLLAACGSNAEWSQVRRERPAPPAATAAGAVSAPPAEHGFRSDLFADLGLPPPSPARGPDGRPGPAYWQNTADYRIEARILPDERAVEGDLVLRYTNSAPHELDFLWFDLPQNAFRTGSRADRVLPPTDRFDAPIGDGLGFEIGPVFQDGQELAPRIDDTRMRLDLNAPLPPGGVATIEIAFRFRVPTPGGQRMGILETAAGEEVWQIAQWFPQVVRFDDVRGWNTLPYLGFGEFYTDFGEYEVALTVPEGWIVAATGELENPHEVLTPAQQEALAEALQADGPVPVIAPEEAGGTGSGVNLGGGAADGRRGGGGGGGGGGVSGGAGRTWRFVASDVRTFAFACSPDYAWEAVGAEVADPRGGTRRVLCQSFYPPSVAELWGGSARMVRHAVEFYSGFFGLAYPYPQMSNTYGVEYGMEYPQIIFCQVDPGDSDHDETPAEALFGVVDHEVGHTWFPMVVNSDERRHPWMDEGFNTFANFYSWNAWAAGVGGRGDGAEGKRSKGFGLRELADFAGEIAGEMSYLRHPPILTPPDRVPGWDAVGHLAYGKPAYGLILLREYILGPERFDDAFRRYVRAWAFASPQPADFFRAIENASGEDLAWFWRGWFAGTGAIDLAVARVHSGAGDATAIFRDLGGIPMPVEYRVTYDDGTTEDRRLPVEAWHATDMFIARWETGARRVERLEIDPRGVLPDVDRANNAWSASRR